MEPLRPEIREPVTFVQRVLYSDAFDTFLGGAIMVLLMVSTFWLVLAAVGHFTHDKKRTQGHAEVSGTHRSVPTAGAGCTAGGGASITGTDDHFELVTGRESSACTITFGTSWDKAPVCTVKPIVGIVQPTCTISSKELACTATMPATTYDVQCLKWPRADSHDLYEDPTVGQDKAILQSLGNDIDSTAPAAMRNLQIITSPAGPKQYDAVFMSDTVFTTAPWLKVDVKPAETHAPTAVSRDLDMRVVVHDMRMIGQLMKDASDGSRDRDFCANHCAGTVECYAIWIEHEPTHMKAVLPCVNGKVGTWEVSRTP